MSRPLLASDTAALKAWRLSSTMTTAIAMSASVAHLMELPAKMRYEPSLYVRLHRTLYSVFGKAAGPAESLAVATTCALAAWTRRRQPDAFTPTAVAAACLAGAHAVYWSVVQPVNNEMSRWPLDAIPQRWTVARNRWEYGHAVRAVLITGALAALTRAALEAPSATSRA
jgi:hypothetical protein